MHIEELTYEQFSKFADKFMLSSIYQTSEYAQVMKNQKYEVVLVGLMDDVANVVAASLILIEKLGKFKYAYAPRGFLIDYTNENLLKEFTEKIKKYLKKKSVMAIKICPLIAKTKYTPAINVTLANPSYDKIFANLKKNKYYHLGYNNEFEALKPRFVAITDLTPKTDIMFNLLHKDFVAKIKNCDYAGIRIYKGTEKNLNFIYEQMREKKEGSLEYVKDMYKYFNEKGKAEVFFAQLDTKTFLVNTQVQYQEQINLCNRITEEVFSKKNTSDSDIISTKIKEDNKLAELKKQLVYATKLIRENPNGIIIACAMVIKYKNMVYLTLDGYDNEYKHLCAKHLLTWKLMEKYGLEGYKQLHLGGITNPHNEETNFRSLNEFKLAFNASSIEYSGDFELVTSLPLYTMYRNSAPIRKVLKK